MLPALCAALLLALSACGINRDDITTYIQGELDCTYKGIIDEAYVELVDGMTEADAQAQYEDNTVAEAERMLYFLGVDYYEEETADQAVMDQAVALVKETASPVLSNRFSGFSAIASSLEMMPSAPPAPAGRRRAGTP